MMQVTLWKRDNVKSGVSLMYLGDAVVVEYDYEGKPKPHEFDTKSQAVEFIIRSAYGLISAGYEVFEDEENSH